MSLLKRMNQIYEDFIYAYARVSTASQDIEQQTIRIKQYLKLNNIPVERVKFFKDDDISANKLSLEKRPGLEELRMLIKQGKVKTLIVYHRDRLARNFYEYALLVKELYKYNVEVIFVATNHPAFSRDFFTEAVHGMLAQNNGLTISSRTQDAMEQFPATPWLGYSREGKKSETRYFPDPKKAPQIKGFFQEVTKIKTAEELIELLIENKTVFHNKRFDEILNYLCNPFYCGHIRKGNHYYKLDHVEPIIDLNTFLKVASNLEKVKRSVLDAINASLERSNITPICARCKTQMKFRVGKLGTSGYYVCSNKHYQIKIHVEELNGDLEDHVKEIMPRLDLDLFNKEIRAILNRKEETLQNKFQSIEKVINKLNDDLALLSPTDSNQIKYLFNRIDVLMVELEQVHSSLSRVDDAFRELKQLSVLIKNFLIEELERYELYYMYQSFIEKIEVDRDKVIYFNPFARFFKGELE
jgi:site-specific DNA recombinase